MKELLNLGELYVSDFLKPGEEPRTGKHELKLILGENNTPRLTKAPPKETMWGERYFYRSGTNNSMTEALKDIVTSITSIIKFKENDLWIDIASNDLTLLGFVPKNLIRVGIDPVKDESFLVNRDINTNLVIQDYFSANVFKKSRFGKLKAKALTSIAVFYDLENPDSFIKDVAEVLDDNGIWVLQLSHTPLMLKQLDFCNVCHEHFYYYSLTNLKTLFEKNGFQIVDCELNEINGGSFRVTAMKQNADIVKYATHTYRNVAKFRVDSLLEYEKTLSLESVDTWKDFYNRIEDLKEKTVSFIKQAKTDGKTVWAYGASSKGATLMQYFGLDHTLIDGIAERSVAKWGLETVGTKIPIYSEDEMRRVQPDFLLILPWHFLSEFIEREKEYLEKGGAFICPCPEFKIIRK